MRVLVSAAVVVAVSATLGFDRADAAAGESETGLRDRQTDSREIPSPTPSKLRESRPAGEFSDADIEIPTGFDPRGVETCRGEVEEPLTCPLRKRVVRVYVDQVTTAPGGADRISQSSFDSVDSRRLSRTLEDMVYGIKRFHVKTRHSELVNAETELERQQGGRDSIKKQLALRRNYVPDAILRVTAKKSADYMYKTDHGEATYTLRLTAALINPYTSLLDGRFRIPATYVESEPMKYVLVNGEYVALFNITDEASVDSLYDDMFARAFYGIVNSMLNFMPAVGRVVALGDGRFTLDRGLEAGIIEDETMIVFEEKGGVFRPLAVGTVQPGHGVSSGRIERWKASAGAEAVQQASSGRTLDTSGLRIYVVSTGASPSYQP